jgi:hypothetical protein
MSPRFTAVPEIKLEVLKMQNSLKSNHSTVFREPKVVLSESFVRKAKFIRAHFLTIHGKLESVVEVVGKITGNSIFCIDCLIPEATVSYSNFHVADRDLARCQEEAEKDENTRHLLPVGEAHYHPWNGKPSPSSVDKENSLRLANLYHPFNIDESNRIRVLKPKKTSPKDLIIRYKIDAVRKFWFLRQKEKKFIPQIYYAEKIKRALWASLIYPANGDSDLVTASVVEHRYRSDKNVKIKRHDEVETVIFSDEKIAELLRWPVEKISLRYDEEILEEQVVRKYHPSGYFYSPQSSDFARYGCVNNHPVVVWQDPNLNYPVLVTADNDFEGHKRGFRFLSQHSNHHDVAALLREAAAILDDEEIEEHDYLSVLADEDDIAIALKESVRILKKTRWN